jgi:hypothetical protein
MDLPVVDLDVFLSRSRDDDAVIRECKKVPNNRFDSLIFICHSDQVTVTRLQMR